MNFIYTGILNGFDVLHLSSTNMDNLNAGAEATADKVVSAVTTLETPQWVQKLINAAVTCGLTLLQAALTAAIGWYLIKLVTRWTKKLLKRSALDDSVSGFLTSCISTVLKVLLVIIVIGIMGIPMSSIVAVIGSAGLAIGLALQGCLTNFAGGVLILVLKPFRVGDYIIESSGFEGTVTAIDIIYTKLLTPDNRAVTIPNGNLANSTVINVTKEKYRRLDFSASIGYDEDIDKVRTVLLKLAEQNDKVLKDKEYTVFVNSFDPSSISVILRLWVKSEDYWSAKWEIQEMIKKAFDANHISIPFDQLDVHMIKKE